MTRLSLPQLNQLREYVIWAEVNDIGWADPEYQANHLQIQAWLIRSIVLAETERAANASGLAPLVIEDR